MKRPVTTHIPDELLPGDDLAGPFTVTLAIASPGRDDGFVSVVEAEDLLGIRQFLRDAARSKVLHRFARSGHPEQLDGAGL